MEIILLKAVRNLGKVGEIVTVKTGYARNFLIPLGFAIRAIKENIEKFNQRKHDLEEENRLAKELALKKVDTILGKHIHFIVQASATDGRLFGSITASLVSDEISKKFKLDLNYTNVILHSAIKYVGLYKVKVILHPEVPIELDVVIGRSDSEIQDILNNPAEFE